MNKTKQLFLYLLLPVDALMVLAAFVIAYYARSKSIPLPVIYIWPFDQYIQLAFGMTPLWLLALALAGCYNNQRHSIKEFSQIIVGASLGAMVLFTWVFAFKVDFFSRIIVFYIWALAIILVALGRVILNLIRENLYTMGLKKINLVLLGELDGTTNHLIDQIKNRPSLGYKIVGIIGDKPSDHEDIKYLGKSDEFEKVISGREVDEVIVTDPDLDNNSLFHYLRICQERKITFKAIPAHAQSGARTLELDVFEGIPVIEFRGTALESWGAIFKRVVDIVGSILAIVLLSWLMIIIAILIKLTSKGPVIYKNIRVGHKGKFITLKFRSMHTDYCTGPGYGGSRAEEFEKELIEKNNIKKDSAVYKIANDPRITPIGHFLRKTSLDELPQFFNSLIGNMSLVGPRPHQPREVEKYTAEQRKLLMIKPGITGLAQISGRSDLSFEEESRLDIFYLENWSFWLDLYIIARTFTAAVKGKGSY